MTAIYKSKEALSKGRRVLYKVCKVRKRGWETPIQRERLFYSKKDHIMEDKEICNKYRKELAIINTMIGEKCDSYKAKGILGYLRGKTYAAAAKERKPYRYKNRVRTQKKRSRYWSQSQNKTPTSRSPRLRTSSFV